MSVLTPERMTRQASRLHVVPERRLALSEELRERQIRKGLYTEHRGERFAIPVDRLDTPEVFQDRVLWQMEARYAPCPDHPQAQWLNGRCVPRVPPSSRVLATGLIEAGVSGSDVREAISEAQRVYGHLGCQRQPVILDRVVSRVGTVDRPPYNPMPRLVLDMLKQADPDVSYRYYMATLGHDLHMSAFAALYGVQWHAGWTNPFMPGVLDEPQDHTFETAPWHPGHVVRKTKACQRHRAFSRDCHECDRLSEPIAEWRLRAKALNWGTYGGLTENLGLLNQALMTQAFDSEIVDELNSATASEFADFDFHEVGTSATAEANTQTALVATSGIARATGTPADEDPDYANDATITADATESWEEHGLFNNSTSAAMMDRNLTGGQAVNSSDQVTYQGTWTFNPET